MPSLREDKYRAKEAGERVVLSKQHENISNHIHDYAQALFSLSLVKSCTWKSGSPMEENLVWQLTAKATCKNLFIQIKICIHDSLAKLENKTLNSSPKYLDLLQWRKRNFLTTVKEPVDDLPGILIYFPLHTCHF